MISKKYNEQMGNYLAKLAKASKPQTNADRIRGMTDEELARLFADDNCGYCHIHDFCYAKGCQFDCENMWLLWLKAPADKEGE